MTLSCRDAKKCTKFNCAAAYTHTQCTLIFSIILIDCHMLLLMPRCCCVPCTNLNWVHACKVIDLSACPHASMCCALVNNFVCMQAVAAAGGTLGKLLRLMNIRRQQYTIYVSGWVVLLVSKRDICEDACNMWDMCARMFYNASMWTKWYKLASNIQKGRHALRTKTRRHECIVYMIILSICAWWWWVNSYV